MTNANRTLGQWLIQSKTRNHIAIKFKYNAKNEDQWNSLTWLEYLEKVYAIAYFLNTTYPDLKNIGIMSATCWQWAAADLAIMGTHKITVPMYPNLSDSDLTYILNHAEIGFLFIETEQHENQLQRISEHLTIKPLYIKWSDFDFSIKANDEFVTLFDSLCESLSPSDVATIVYTSGTTGLPKGVVLLHEALYSEIVEGFEIFGIKKEYTSLTFLPFAHILGRIEHLGSCYLGHTIAYAESIDKLKDNLKEIKPDFLIAVPRIFEKVYAGIMAKIETQFLKQKIFLHSLEIAKQIEFYRSTKQNIPWSLLLQYETYCKQVFAPIITAFGGNLKFAISGGAPLGAQLSDFFSACGILILEGYGLTETTAAITVNNLICHQSGTVGLPIGDVQIRFAEDNEILIKSKKCLKEYYKNPEATAASIKDGYFATGDIGYLTEKGFLKITDRKKDLIKTSGGKYVAPQKLQALIMQESLVSYVLIIGDQQKYITALISIDELTIQNWAQSQNIISENTTDLFSHPHLRIRIQKHIQKINSELASYESIKKFEIVTSPWSIENQCLTQSLKMKRNVIIEKYKILIDEMYD